MFYLMIIFCLLWFNNSLISEKKHTCNIYIANYIWIVMESPVTINFNITLYKVTFLKKNLSVQFSHISKATKIFFNFFFLCYSYVSQQKNLLICKFKISNLVCSKYRVSQNNEYTLWIVITYQCIHYFGTPCTLPNYFTVN